MQACLLRDEGPLEQASLPAQLPPKDNPPKKQEPPESHGQPQHPKHPKHPQHPTPQTSHPPNHPTPQPPPTPPTPPGPPNPPNPTPRCESRQVRRKALAEPLDFPKLCEQLSLDGGGDLGDGVVRVAGLFFRVGIPRLGWF